MGFFDGYNVATSGMSAQRTRINVVSSNIANAQSTHSKDGKPYEKQNVVFKEILLGSQDKSKLKQSSSTIDPLALMGVKVSEIGNYQDEKVVMKFEPNHPDANKDGYVAYPNINHVIEMVDLIEDMRS